jgi:signal transduction histidine kinase
VNTRHAGPGGLVARLDLSATGGEEADHQLARLGRIERLGELALAVLPYAMLVISNVLTAVVPESRPALPVTLIVSAALAGWMLLLFTLRPAWRERGAIMAVFMVGWLALTAVLVAIDGWFGFFSYTGYFLAFWVGRGTWRAIAVIAVAVLTGTAQNGGAPGMTGHGSVLAWAVIVGINIAVGGGLNFFGTVADRQSTRRRELLAELSEANLKLEATLRENAGLQAQLLAQAREAGVADERQRMAREIHDTTTQGLAGIITQLQAADQAELAGTDFERRRHLAAAAELARESLTEARRAVRELRPGPLQPGRLADALRDVAARWSRLHQVEASVTVDGGAVPLTAATEVVLLRVAQEALANVAKHARARRVGVTLSYFGDEVTLDVRDNGVGFEDGPVSRASESPALHGGFGLTGMRERLAAVSGRLTIETEPGGGTAVSATVPLTAAAAAPVPVASPVPAAVGQP